jgi:hypothetical protein
VPCLLGEYIDYVVSGTNSTIAMVLSIRLYFLNYFEHWFLNRGRTRMDSWLTSTMLSNSPWLFLVPRNGANKEVQVTTYVDLVPGSGSTTRY